ncbi:hypothetical protein V5E97_17470 [Singulisphaera sp. Ch08]|uniref:Peptidase MA-like domain-containing protein n=1 Tax=Singulisphaera sp. Ch08 TaxID=3120278 RepID=A0AAU7CR44_9BACT
MHRSRSAAVLVATLLFVYSLNATADSREVLDQARALLDRSDARGAVVLLEKALIGEPTQRTAVLDLLRQAYGRAADEAEAAGDRTNAEMFRDNFEILNRKPKSSEEKARAVSDPGVERAAAPAPASAPEQSPAPSMDVAAQRLTAPDSSPALEEPPPAVATPPLSATTPSAVAVPRPLVTAPAPVASPAQVESVPPVTAETRPNEPELSVAAADAAFSAKQYAEAGRLYMLLAQGKKLPESRRDHLAYCRCAEVVRRINAKPTSAEEWKSIDAEVRQIRDLSPGNWYAEYLRNLTSERSPSLRARPSRKLVLRGSAPEEVPSYPPASEAGSPTSSQPSPAATSPSTPAPAAPPRNSSPAVVGDWQIRETTNFRILHADAVLAEQVAQVVEAAREAQVKRWLGATARSAWSPRCDVYVYPSGKSFSRMTGQTEESPGFSTMGMNAGRIVTRRINVRADHPNLVVAILPHEVTHVVLADLFPTQQVPRWADEGMAVLAEPDSEQRLRAADLDKPLTSGQLFKLNDLMVMDYPDGKYWGLYYAQSVSLTRFLVDQGSPAQFIQFVQGSQQRGLEAELKRVYQIDGFEDLQNRWLEYARNKSSDLTAGLAKNSEKSSQ